VYVRTVCGFLVDIAVYTWALSSLRLLDGETGFWVFGAQQSWEGERGRGRGGLVTGERSEIGSPYA